MNKWCEKEIDELLSLISIAQNKEEVHYLLDLILTPREINDMARRFKILEMLEDGKSYADIVCEIRVARHTISRVSNKIGFGFRRCESSISTRQGHFRFPYRLVKSRLKYKGAPIYTITKSDF
ncbi:trp operon repressor [Patescibacteria group bacterium]|jgi:TrpR-related protein YerC/YecD|nr:trp operon repressor [Patescibacteria group bacterium]